MKTTVEVLSELWKNISLEQLKPIAEHVFPNGTIVSFIGRDIGCRSVPHFVQMLEDYGGAVRGSIYDRFIVAYRNIVGNENYLNELVNACDPVEHVNGQHIGSTRDQKINEIIGEYNELRVNFSNYNLNVYSMCEKVKKLMNPK